MIPTHCWACQQPLKTVYSMILCRNENGFYHFAYHLDGSVQYAWDETLLLLCHDETTLVANGKSYHWKAMQFEEPSSPEDFLNRIKLLVVLQ